MGEYEPNDSRRVTLNPETAPGEPPRTGPREAETRVNPDRSDAEASELNEDQRGDDGEATISQAEAQQAAARERSMEEDAEELNAPGSRFDPGRND